VTYLKQFFLNIKSFFSLKILIEKPVFRENNGGIKTIAKNQINGGI